MSAVLFGLNVSTSAARRGGAQAGPSHPHLAGHLRQPRAGRARTVVLARAGRAAPGSRTLKEQPPPGRSSTQARPPCSSAKLLTSDSPIPTPGACGAAVAPCWNASKTTPRRSGERPGPASSTAISTPSRCPATFSHTGVPGGVCLTALMSRFSTIRSTFGASTQTTSEGASTVSGWPASASIPLASWRASAPTSVGRQVGSRIPRLSRSRSSRSTRSRSSLRALVPSRRTSSTRSAWGAGARSAPG